MCVQMCTHKDWPKHTHTLTHTDTHTHTHTHWHTHTLTHTHTHTHTLTHTHTRARAQCTICPFIKFWDQWVQCNTHKTVTLLERLCQNSTSGPHYQHWNAAGLATGVHRHTQHTMTNRDVPQSIPTPTVNQAHLAQTTYLRTSGKHTPSHDTHNLFCTNNWRWS